MKNHQPDDSGTRKENMRHRNTKIPINKTRVERTSKFFSCGKLREGTWYFWWNPGKIFPEYPEVASNPKYKWAFKTATQNLYSESQKAESQSGNKNPQSTKDEEENMSAFRSCPTGTQKFIQAKILFTHVLSNIVGDAEIKLNE